MPIAANLFAETPGGPRLLGSRCVTCGTPYFPKADLCRNPECSESRLEDAEFGPRGRLWSCAVQNYPPPAPTRFDPPYKPYALGVVDTEDGLRVVSRIACDDPNSIEPNIDVELVIEPMCHDEEGNELLTWMFRPA
ncbi:MAG: benzoylsuccinyl-CoA thiolase [Deltaproteobacteria bacterium]|nr:MAG: benzoylsuccinyl-CoA thiolase [Deltaproteobacteria bacterium]